MKPVTEPKRSQKSKGPASFTVQPDGYSFSCSALMPSGRVHGGLSRVYQPRVAGCQPAKRGQAGPGIDEYRFMSVKK